MSKILSEYVYDCECHSYCSKKSKFNSSIDNVGNVFITHTFHINKLGLGEFEEKVGLFNPSQIKALKKLLNES